MNSETKNNGKVIMSVLAFIGLLVVIVVGASVWFTFDDSRGVATKVREVAKKVQPVVKEVLDETTKVIVKVHEGTTSILTARKRYEEALDEFDVQKEQYSQELEEGKNVLLTFQEAMKIAQDKDVEFAKVYTKWESIESAVEQIQEKFANLITGADILYAELERRAECITGEHLREITLAKIAKSRKLYSLRLRECQDGVNKLSIANTLVQNTMIALEVSYGLDVLEETIDRTLREINEMVEAVMVQLEKLTQESRQLLEIRIEEVLTQ